MIHLPGDVLALDAFYQSQAGDIAWLCMSETEDPVMEGVDPPLQGSPLKPRLLEAMSETMLQCPGLFQGIGDEQTECVSEEEPLGRNPLQHATGTVQHKKTEGVT